MGRLSFGIAAIGLLGLAISPANAMPPPDILGSWSGFVDNTPVDLTLKAGTTRSGACDPITGTITDQTTGLSTTLVGFYCPGTGRFSFLRFLGSPSKTIQTFVGNASEVGHPIKPPQYLTGTFGQEATAAGTLDLGEYSFEVTR